MIIMHDKNMNMFWLSQGKYIEKVLNVFKIKGAKPIVTPTTSHFKLRIDLFP